MTYFAATVTLSPYQKEKIAIAVRNKRGTTVRLAASELAGPDKIILTKRQLARIDKARASGTGLDIRLSKTQLSKQGGFLGALLAGLAASLLPQLLGKGIVLPGTPPQSGRGKKKRAKGLMLPGTTLPFIGNWSR